MLTDGQGGWRADLARGDRKSLHSDRVVLALGPAREQRLVRRIFTLFTRDGLEETAIARWLNARGHRNVTQALWTRNVVHDLLSNSIYVGRATYNRRSQRLGGPRTRNAPSFHLTVDGVVPAIIMQDVFDAAQAIIAGHPRPYSREAVTCALRALLAREGRPTYDLIDADPKSPSASTVSRQFGGLENAYAAVGFDAAPHQGRRGGSRKVQPAVETGSLDAKPLLPIR